MSTTCPTCGSDDPTENRTWPGWEKEAKPGPCPNPWHEEVMSHGQAADTATAVHMTEGASAPSLDWFDERFQVWWEEEYLPAGARLGSDSDYVLRKSTAYSVALAAAQEATRRERKADGVGMRDLIAAVEAVDKFMQESGLRTEDEEGFVSSYTIPVGPWHRLLGVLSRMPSGFLYSRPGPTLVAERDALKARVERLEAALRGIADHDDFDNIAREDAARALEEK